jgi:catalase
LAYADTQRHRLGVNFIQLPINKPDHSFSPLMRDGAATFNGLGATPNYFPSSFTTYGIAPQYAQPDEEHWLGTVVNFESQLVDADFSQARIFWEKTLAGEPGQQDNFVSNVAGHLMSAAAQVRTVTYGMLPYPYPGSRLLYIKIANPFILCTYR